MFKQSSWRHIPPQRRRAMWICLQGVPFPKFVGVPHRFGRFFQVPSLITGLNKAETDTSASWLSWADYCLTYARETSNISMLSQQGPRVSDKNHVCLKKENNCKKTLLFSGNITSVMQKKLSSKDFFSFLIELCSGKINTGFPKTDEAVSCFTISFGSESTMVRLKNSIQRSN